MTQDGEWLATVPADVLMLNVGGLEPWTTYGFEIRARDSHDNLSWESLETSGKTTDESAPMWSTGFLQATEVTASTVTLAWPLPMDDVGVVNCQVMVDGEAGPLLSGETTETIGTWIPGPMWPSRWLR